MLRITELMLPIEHAPDALAPAICARLKIRATDLQTFTVFKRAYDARRRTAGLCFVYTIDCALRDEAAVLQRFADDRHVGKAPDTRYHPVATAPAGLTQRPLVIGFGPCGLFAALVLAQMGFRPIVLERGKPVRQRTQAPGGCGASTR